MPSYPWYAIAGSKDGLEQGDLINTCSIIEPVVNLENDEIQATESTYNVVVMSQSCDLVNKKLNIILVCPCWELSEMERSHSWFRSKDNKEHLRRGHQPNYHLLNSCDLGEGLDTDFLVVDFRNVFGVPRGYLERKISTEEKRIRLLSPYKEHLAQAFARFFMRVGLPVDIERFASSV